MKWNDMVRVDHLGIDDEPLGFSGRVYLDNEYQETCVSADAVAGCIRRFVTTDDGTPVYEDVFGDVKIFVSKKLLTEYRGKIPDILPYRLYTVSAK